MTDEELSSALGIEASSVGPRIVTLEQGIDALKAFVVEDITTVDGAYVHPITGAITSNAAFIYTLVAVGPGDQIRASGRVAGSGVSLAVYFDDAMVRIGKEIDGTTTAVDVRDHLLTLPAGTRTVALVSRVGFPITARRFDVVSADALLSTWDGKVIDVLGDSNVQMGRWQPLVTRALGCIFLNHGVGGSKIAKPDSAPTQVSMVDDVRLNALSLAADAWICGPWGTNDWAQRIVLGSINDTVDTTVYGALNLIAQKLRARAPTKPIFWATPFNADYDAGRTGSWVDGSNNGHGTLADYAAAIRAVAFKFGFPLIDLSADCGWNAWNSSHFLMTEGAGNQSRIHLPPTGPGPDRISSLVANRLKTLAPLAH